MKNLLFVFALLLSAGLSAQTLTINTATATVETSTKYIVFPVSKLYFTYNSDNSKFEVRDLLGRSVVYSAAISTVSIDTFTTVTNKLNALEATHIRAVTGTTTYFFPQGNVSIRQRYPYVEVWSTNGEAKSSLWTGSADDLDLDTSIYDSAVGYQCDLVSSLDLDQAVFTANDSIKNATLACYGNGLVGRIGFTTGSATGLSGPLITVTLPREVPDGSFVFLYQRNAISGAHATRLYAGTVNKRQWTVAATGTALSASTAYAYDYLIVGYRWAD